jgi:carboxypeptidase Taq
MASALEQLRERLAEVSDLGRARALLAWDERTQMPPAGADARAAQLATLAGVRHQRLSADETGRLLDAAAVEAEEEADESEGRCLVAIASREWEKARRVPAELRSELTRCGSLAEHAWVAARRRSDFAGLLPHLRRNVELRRRYADCFHGFEQVQRPYDALLDDFEPGMSTEEIATLLADLREGVAALVAEVGRGGRGIDDSCLRGAFPLEAQQRLVSEVLERLPLPAGGWRLDSTAHPFASAISTTDIRLTTSYDPAYVGAALWSTIHEAGHGLYESGIGAELRRTPLCRPPSLGLHESQSRLWENWVGRGRPFLGWLHPRLAGAFPDALGETDAEELYRATHRIEPTPIRILADEVTYNLHIVLRFELELEIFEGNLALADLPEAWASRTSDYLGLEVPDDARGVLQDVHWAAGSFGYFPTYSLGNVMAAQIWDAVAAELPELDSQLAAGDFEPLFARLRERLYRHGGKLMPRPTFERAAGATLSVEPYLRYLREMASDVYGCGARGKLACRDRRPGANPPA